MLDRVQQGRDQAQIAGDRAVRRQASTIQSEAGRRGLIQGAMVAIDPRNGEIRALSGGRTYERGAGLTSSCASGAVEFSCKYRVNVSPACAFR